MNKLLAIYTALKPALDLKVPMFKQTVQQFSTSKSNWLGGFMIFGGLYLLYSNPSSEFGLMLAGNGIGFITLKDAAVKNGQA